MEIKRQGIDFFPLGVDFLYENQVRRVTKSHGMQAVAVLIEIYSMIYRWEGYFIVYDDELIFGLYDFLGIEEEEIEKIIEKAVQHNLFDKEKFEKYGILTSLEIQHNFRFATKRRKNNRLNPDYEIILHAVNGQDTP